MEQISNMLFWISNGLLVPVIILLLLFFLKSLLMVGGFFGQFMSRKKAEKEVKTQLRLFIDGNNQALTTLQNTKNGFLFSRYCKALVEHKNQAEVGEHILSNFEIEADKDIARSKTLSKMGPILGLMGTLIPMGPALVGLSSGDIGSMAYNMQVAFATTVVGLVIGAIGSLTVQIKQRWYLQDLTNLELIRKKLINGA